MTYEEMRDSIRIKIDDPNSTRFTTEQLRVTINEAYKHLYRELIRQGIFTDIQETTIDFVSGSQEIAFGAGIFDNIQKIVSVHDADNIPIPVYREEFSTRSNERSVYLKRTLVVDGADDQTKTEKTYLGWYVQPTSSFTISVHYKPKVSEFGLTVLDSSRLDLVPVEHHDVVVLRAVVLLLGADEDNAQFWFSIYREALQSMIESVSLENEVASEVVDVMSEDYYATNRGQ